MSEKKHPTFEYIGPAGLKVMADLRTRLEETISEKVKQLEAENASLRTKLDKVREIPNIAGICDECRSGIQNVINEILNE